MQLQTSDSTALTIMQGDRLSPTRSRCFYSTVRKYFRENKADSKLQEEQSCLHIPGSFEDVGFITAFKPRQPSLVGNRSSSMANKIRDAILTRYIHANRVRIVNDRDSL